MAWLRRLSAVALAVALLAPGPAQAASREPKRLDRTVRYLQDVQHGDGGFGEGRSVFNFSAWAALALAADGVNPRDQRKPGGTDAYTYLTRHTAGLHQSTDFELDAAGRVRGRRVAGPLRPCRSAAPVAGAPAP